MEDEVVKMSDVDILETKTVDSNGRLYIGEEYSGKNVRVAMKFGDENE